MSVRRKPAIARAFDRAEAYDAHALIQRAAAVRLAGLIAELDVPGDAAILEIGCGTGFLSVELARIFPHARLILSDLSPTMVRRARKAVDAQFLVMDGERPALRAGAARLICSSLTFQWFEDLGAAIVRLHDLLPPGGHLAFTTLAAGTFAEWRAAHGAAGATPATRDFPTLAEIAAACPAAARIETQTLVEPHADGRVFLRGLKAIGAQTPWGTRPPLSPATMRQVLRAFDRNGASVTYEIAHVLIRKMPEDL